MGDLQCLVPITIKDTDLIYSNVPETDYAVWSSGTTYAKGARVIRTTSTTHNVYESVAASNLNNTPENTLGTWWVLVSKTNLFKAFDDNTSSLTANAGSIRHYIALPDPVAAVSMHKVEAGRVFVGLIKTSSPGARRNLMTTSEVFDNAFYSETGASLGVTPLIAPWGAYTATRLVEDTSTGLHYIEGQNFLYTSGQSYVFSVYVSRTGGGGSKDVQIDLDPAAFPGTPRMIFNLGTGAITSHADTVDRGFVVEANGFYRIWIRAVADASVLAYRGRVYIMNGGTASYTGVGDSLKIVGWQVENATALSAYQFIATALLYGDRTYAVFRDASTLSGADLTDAVFTAIGGVAGDLLEIAVYANGGTAQLGELKAGQYYKIGALIEGTTGGSRTLSTEEFDTFGNLTTIGRGTRRMVEYALTIATVDRNRIMSFLEYLDIAKVVFFDDTDLLNVYGLLAFGYLPDFDIPVPMHENIVGFTLRVETLR